MDYYPIDWGAKRLLLYWQLLRIPQRSSGQNERQKFAARRSSDFLFGLYVGFGPLDGYNLWSQHVEWQKYFLWDGGAGLAACQFQPSR
jgi:hypothetical protein